MKKLFQRLFFFFCIYKKYYFTTILRNCGLCGSKLRSARKTFFNKLVILTSRCRRVYIISSQLLMQNSRDSNMDETPTYYVSKVSTKSIMCPYMAQHTITITITITNQTQNAHTICFYFVSRSLLLLYNLLECEFRILSTKYYLPNDLGQLGLNILYTVNYM